MIRVDKLTLSFVLTARNDSSSSRRALSACYARQVKNERRASEIRHFSLFPQARTQQMTQNLIGNAAKSYVSRKGASSVAQIHFLGEMSRTKE